MQSPGAKEVVPAAMADGSVRVVALKGNEPVGAWEFEKDAVTIGRSKTADVRLDDAAISRVHCTISVRPAGVFIIDHGSRNGIWLNGRRVTEAMLSSRDEVVVERFRIKAYMVWGQNTAASKFADRVDEKTHANQAPAAKAAAPKAAERISEKAIPASQLKTEIPRGKAVLAKPAAIAPVAPAAPAHIPAPPTLEATNAMPDVAPKVSAKPAANFVGSSAIGYTDVHGMSFEFWTQPCGGSTTFGISSYGTISVPMSSDLSPGTTPCQNL